jgi:hypothetical protein
MPRHLEHHAGRIRGTGTACGILMLLLAALGCERMDPGMSALHDRPVELQGGMGLSEAAGALGSDGKEEASGMRTTPAFDSEVWNVEWRVGRVYDIDETRVVAIYAAWGSSDSSEEPPSSAYRLVDWSTDLERGRHPITLWNAGG